MKLKIEKGSELYDNLVALIERAREVRRIQKEFIEELGATQYISSPYEFAGKISGIFFDTKPEGWKQVATKHYNNAYYPKKIKANKELLDKIENMEIVPLKDFTDLINYDVFWGSGSLSSNPGIMYKDDVFILDAPDWVYDQWDRPAECVEITVSEYNEIKETINT